MGHEMRMLRECQLRMKVREYAPVLEKCIQLQTQKNCNQELGCKWGAQKDLSCGINEETLVMRLAADVLREHPIIQAFILSSDCGKLSVQDCAADKSDNCRWGGAALGREFCDVDRVRLFESLFANPRLILMLELAQAGAACRATYEHT